MYIWIWPPTWERKGTSLSHLNILWTQETHGFLFERLRQPTEPKTFWKEIPTNLLISSFSLCLKKKNSIEMSVNSMPYKNHIYDIPLLTHYRSIKGPTTWLAHRRNLSCILITLTCQSTRAWHYQEVPANLFLQSFDTILDSQKLLHTHQQKDSSIRVIPWCF